MRKEPLGVEVYSVNSGEIIGHLTTAEFMAWGRENGCGQNEFLQGMVEKINAWKESINEPERARVVLNK